MWKTLLRAIFHTNMIPDLWVNVQQKPRVTPSEDLRITLGF